jgi:hypothetical protein
VNNVDDVWLSRYPRPAYIGFDNAGEYKNALEELMSFICASVINHDITKVMGHQ